MTATSDELSIIDHDTRHMLWLLQLASIDLHEANDAETLRWLHKRVAALTRDAQARTREAVTR